MKKNESLTLNEIAVLDLVNAGVQSITEIKDATGLYESAVKEICKTLANNKYIVFDETKEIPSSRREKTIKLGGNLNLPISTFEDGDGVLYVVRGTWHKITDASINLQDIEWFDDTDKESDLQKAMRGIEEQKTKQKKAALPDIKDEDGEASEEAIKYLGAWRNVGENVKIYPCVVSKKRAIIEISPRYISEEVEFPYGSCSPKVVIPVEDMIEMIETGNTEKLPKYTIDDAIMYLPNCLPVQPSKGGWEYLSTKKTKNGIKIIRYDFQIIPQEKFHTLDTVEFGIETASEYIKKIAKAFVENKLFNE